MAHGRVELRNPATGEVKLAPVGYSWTVLFWGFFPALFRQDWKYAGIMLGIIIVAGLIFEGAGFIPLILFSFIYNDKMHLKDLLDSGWRIAGYSGTKNLAAVEQSIGYSLDKFTHVK
jgi:hypothetical protein